MTTTSIDEVYKAHCVGRSKVHHFEAVHAMFLDGEKPLTSAEKAEWMALVAASREATLAYEFTMGWRTKEFE